MTWGLCTVGDLIDSGHAEVKTGPFGTQLKASDYVAHGTPVINVRNIGFGSIRNEKLEYISEETVQRLSSHLLQAGDIVFGRKGAVERHAFIRNAQERWFQGSDCLRLRITSEEKVLSRYLSYAFLTSEHQSWMKQHCSHGATMASLNQDIIRRIMLNLPSLEVQRRITSTLSAYDDLIENNTRRIEILEEMARRLYEEWFVHFRFPGHEDARFEGALPEGWAIARLDTVAVLNPENVNPRKAPEEINYVDISSVSPGRIDKLQPMIFSEAPGRARRKVASGDIIWSCVRPNLRSRALIIDPKPNTVVSTGFAVVRAESLPFGYLYQVLSSDDFVSYLVNHATGAAYPAVKQSDFEAAEILCPRKDVLEEFERLVLPMLRLTHSLLLKSANLRTQRDLLLPSLISGEINVSQIPMPT